MPKKPASSFDKEEAKINAATEAASRRSKGKETKDKTLYYVKVAGAVTVCIFAVAIVAYSGSPKKGKEAKLQAYVNDYYTVRDVTAAADGNFTATASPFFNKWTLADAKYGLDGVGVSNMIGISGAVQYCESDDGTEGGALPPAYDMRESHQSCIGEVADSGNCSSSYAIAAADALAMRYCIADSAKYANVRLSSQQILSCDKKSAGCNGGGVDNVWAYIQRRGLYPEECLPYAGEKGSACKTTCDESSKLKVLGHCVMSKEKALKREIYNKGPVVVPIYLKSEYLVYGGGVYSPLPEPNSAQMYDSEGHAMMHAVVLLGWGKTQGTPYWIVKHSWGTGWGEGGYARVTGSIVRDSYAIVATPATEVNVQAAAEKEAAAAKRKEEAKAERAARDERIREQQKAREAEKAASSERTGSESDSKDDGSEAEVDSDAGEDVDIS